MSIKNQLKDQSNQLLTITFHNKIENLNAHRVDITIDNKTKTILFDGGIQSFDVLQTTLQSLVDNTKFAQSISSNFTTAGKGLSDDEITLVDIFNKHPIDTQFNEISFSSEILQWLKDVKLITPNMQRRIIAYLQSDFRKKLLEKFNVTMPNGTKYGTGSSVLDPRFGFLLTGQSDMTKPDTDNGYLKAISKLNKLLDSIKPLNNIQTDVDNIYNKTASTDIIKHTNKWAKQYLAMNQYAPYIQKLKDVFYKSIPLLNLLTDIQFRHCIYKANQIYTRERQTSPDFFYLKHLIHFWLKYNSESSDPELFETLQQAYNSYRDAIQNNPSDSQKKEARDKLYSVLKSQKSKVFATIIPQAKILDEHKKDIINFFEVLIQYNKPYLTKYKPYLDLIDSLKQKLGSGSATSGTFIETMTPANFIYLYPFADIYYFQFSLAKSKLNINNGRAEFYKQLDNFDINDFSKKVNDLYAYPFNQYISNLQKIYAEFSSTPPDSPQDVLHFAIRDLFHERSDDNKLKSVEKAEFPVYITDTTKAELEKKIKNETTRLTLTNEIEKAIPKSSLFLFKRKYLFSSGNNSGGSTTKRNINESSTNKTRKNSHIYNENIIE